MNKQILNPSNCQKSRNFDKFSPIDNSKMSVRTTNEEAVLIASIEEVPCAEESSFTVEWSRWYILFVMAFSSLNQSLTWFTYSSLEKDRFEDFFGPKMTQFTINLLLNWGPIVGLITFPVQVYLSNRRNGFKRCLQLAIWLTLFGNIIRTVPIFWGKQFRESTFAFGCYHFGQMLNAASGPFIMGTVTQVSCLWFAEDERVFATAIAQTSNGFGTAVGFLAGSHWCSSDVTSLLIYCLLMSVVPAFFALIYLPERPTNYPSMAAKAADSNYSAPLFEMPLLNGDSQPISNRKFDYAWVSYFILVIATGILAGVINSWQALLQSILNPAGFKGSTVGTIGFINVLAGNIFAVIAGCLMDKCFHRRLKAGLVISFLVWTIAMILVTLTLPSFLYKVPPLDQYFSDERLWLAFLVLVAGSAQGVSNPLTYELAAELIWPVNEGISAGIIVFILNGVSIVVVFVGSELNTNYMNFITTMTCALVFVMVLFIKEAYNRPTNSSTDREGEECCNSSIDDSALLDVSARYNNNEGQGGRRG